MVGEVDARGAHRDAYLPWAGRRRVRTFLHLKDREVTMLCDYDGTHTNSTLMK
jgi:hypothetical protein